MEEDKGTLIFNRVSGIILFILGVGIEVKNFFFTSQVNGYELVFGIEFITVGIFLFYGKFKGFRNVTT